MLPSVSVIHGRQLDGSEGATSIDRYQPREMVGADPMEEHCKDRAHACEGAIRCCAMYEFDSINLEGVMSASVCIWCNIEWFAAAQV